MCAGTDRQNRNHIMDRARHSVRAVLGWWRGGGQRTARPTFHRILCHAPSLLGKYGSVNPRSSAVKSFMGCSPHCSLCCPAYAHSMAHHTISQVQKQKNADDRKPTVAADLNQNETEPAPSPGEVASRAYFSYVNQGSQHGHDVRHWLEAETQLLADRLNASPQPPKRVRPIAKSRDTRTVTAASAEEHGADRMKTGQDPQSLFHICALL